MMTSRIAVSSVSVTRYRSEVEDKQEEPRDSGGEIVIEFLRGVGRD